MFLMRVSVFFEITFTRSYAENARSSTEMVDPVLIGALAEEHPQMNQRA